MELLLIKNGPTDLKDQLENIVRVMLANNTSRDMMGNQMNAVNAKLDRTIKVVTEFQLLLLLE